MNTLDLSTQEFGLALDLVADWQLDRIREQCLWPEWDVSFNKSIAENDNDGDRNLATPAVAARLTASFCKIVAGDKYSKPRWIFAEVGRTKGGLYMAAVTSWSAASAAPDAQDLVDKRQYRETQCETAGPNCVRASVLADACLSG